MDKLQLTENIADDIIRNIRKLLYYLSIVMLGALISYSYLVTNYISVKPINLTIINPPQECIALPVTWS